ncbi:MAG: hypothetical protein RLZZ494_249 [Pseudomonadota bacterium]
MAKQEIVQRFRRIVCLLAEVIHRRCGIIPPLACSERRAMLWGQAL